MNLTEALIVSIKTKKRELETSLEANFGLKLGDYLEVETNGGWSTAYIIDVNSCYINQLGTHTAELKVARHLSCGGLGTGRYLRITGHSGGHINGITSNVRKLNL